MESEKVNEYVVNLRRYFHENPELSFNEFGTADRIEKELNYMGLTCRRIGKTGIACDINGFEKGKTVALRADMDALPVLEEVEVPFMSRNKGIMHACGHDAHTAMLLGAAKLLVENRASFKGTVRLIFQAAEETTPGGAIDFIKADELRGVSAIVGQHVTSLMPSGTVAAYPGRAMAGSDEFRIRIIGKGGHGSDPSNSIDALVIASYFVDAAQAIVSRMIPTFNPAVVTFGTFNSGYRFNIIAQYADLTGTVRSFDDEIRAKVRSSLERLLSGICNSYGATYEFNYLEGYPVVVNDPVIDSTVEEVAKTVVGAKNVFHPDPIMGSEDFSYYLKEVPGAFFFLGVGNQKKGIVSPNHSPTFKIDEDAMKYGVEILYRSALKLLGV
ncbi:MAG: amidohydrolase [Thermoplasmataceae archaeon]